MFENYTATSHDEDPEKNKELLEFIIACLKAGELNIQYHQEHPNESGGISGGMLFLQTAGAAGVMIGAFAVGGPLGAAAAAAALAVGVGGGFLTSKIISDKNRAQSESSAPP